MKKTPSSQLELFFRDFAQLHYKKGETILRAEDTPTGVYFLSKGFVRLYAVSQKGEELTLIIFKSGDFFPVMWAVNNARTNYYLETMTNVDLWRVPQDKFLVFIKSNPEVFFELTSKILVRFGGLLKRMEYLVFGNAYAKVASIITICAERFGRREKGKVIIEVPLTHSDLASMVGVTRETASIEIKKIEKKGLIGHQGRLIVVKNLKGLRKESLLES
ncbi:hypothetical protein A2693_02565 [Candidatus Curtissbacteria bacterium RIFCSPHIGHO2_01_FULL_40_12]|uniref:HTH crp-type domain-containing protein n=1 Tax=Candidatus Curtissbacteria bacterium RIFCSPHIGHO2_01_FULL_40_12 TaxID=1797710 RepID=A0A1F5G8H7_9BACT|nr:MAG: hypothetical protein A2693_02565 [Candidatus Curtissbacteria bacterium RIFCSPHIGHO2_01_FULL_40_12]